MKTRDSAKLTGRRLGYYIAIDEYEDPLLHLSNAKNDVLAIREVLQARYGYQETHPPLLDRQATRDAIHDLLRAAAEQVQEPDSVILYFAGHGIGSDVDEFADGPRGQLLPADARLTGSSEDVTRLFPMSQLVHRLKSLRCRHLLLILDCCFAGAIRWSLYRNVRPRSHQLYRQTFERYQRERAWQVLTSTAHNGVALDVMAVRPLGSRGERGSHSPFGLALREGLEGAADTVTGNRDRVILAAELHLYIESRLSASERKQERVLQYPQIFPLDTQSVAQFFFVEPSGILELPDALPVARGNNPYAGLDPYPPASGAPFHGRDEERGQLLGSVLKNPLTLLLGASGSGKTSLLRMGLLPDLRAKVGDTWRVLCPTGAETPEQTLAALVHELAPGQPVELPHAVEKFLRQNVRQRLLVLLDPLEVLLPHTAPAEQHQAFWRTLMAAQETAGEQVRIVVSLRSHCRLAYAAWLPAAAAGAQLELLPPRPEFLRQIIEWPLEARALLYESQRLIDYLLDETRDVVGALPLLSDALSQIYLALLGEPGGDERTIRSEHVRRVGGVRGALLRRADEVYHALEKENLTDVLLRLMIRLVDLQDGLRMGRRTPLAEVLDFPADSAEGRGVRSVLARLVAARLLVLGSTANQQPFVEPAHPVLLVQPDRHRELFSETAADAPESTAAREAARDAASTPAEQSVANAGWEKVWRYLNAEQENWQAQRHLTERATAWSQAKETLWNDSPQFRPAYHLLQQQPARFNQLETRFLRLSRRRQLRDLTLWVLGGVLAIFALTAALLRERHNAATIRQQLLASHTEQARQRLLAGDWGASLPYLEQACQVSGQSTALPYLIARATQSAHALQATLVGHSQNVWSATFSPDGQQVATASDDMTIKLWYSHTGALVRTLTGHRKLVWLVRYSPDGQRLASASDDHTVRLWDPHSGKPLAELDQAGQPAFVVKFSPDGLLLATGHAKGARLYEAPSGRWLYDLPGHTDRVNSLDFSPDGRWLVTGCADAIARVFEVKTGKLLAELKGHDAKYSVLQAAFSPDSRRIVTASNDRTARIWDAESGGLLHTLLAHGSSLSSAEFSPDGQYVLTAGRDSAAYLWDSQKGRRRLALLGHRSGILAAHFSPDGQRVLTAGQDKAAKLWDVHSGMQLGSLDGHLHPIWSAEFSRDGEHIITASADQTAKLWSSRIGPLQATLRGHTSIVESVTFSPNGTQLLTASRDRTARLIDLRSGALLQAFTDPDAPLEAAVFRADGQRIATTNAKGTVRLWGVGTSPAAAALGSYHGIAAAGFGARGQRLVTAGADGQVREWDSDSGRLQHEFLAHPAGVKAMAMDDDGKLLLTAGADQTAKIWDATRGALMVKIDDLPQISTVAMDAHGQWAAIAGVNGHLTLLRVHHRTRVEVPAHQEDIYTAEYSPDGQLLLTASADKTARLWYSRSGELKAVLQGHSSMLYGARFSPDGKLVVTYSVDQSARVWDISSGALLAILNGHTSSVRDAAFRPDGNLLATASQDNTVRLWTLPGAACDVPALHALARQAEVFAAHDQF